LSIALLDREVGIIRITVFPDLLKAKRPGGVRDKHLIDAVSKEGYAFAIA
jgi:hypothetical protein